MTAPTIIPTQHEGIRSTGEPIIINDFPYEMPDFSGLQDCPPAEALFVHDAVVAMSDEVAAHFPEEVVESAREKVESAVKLSITLSMRQSALSAILSPKDVTPEEFEALSSQAQDYNDEMNGVATTRPEESDQPYTPNFDDEDEPLDPRTNHLVACAWELAANALDNEERSRRANAAVAAYEQKMAEAAQVSGVLGSADANRVDELIDREQCTQRTFEELTAATNRPIFLTHSEAAVVSAAVHTYDAEAYREVLARELVSSKADEELQRCPTQRLGLVAVQEFTGHESMRERVAVWTAGIVARAAAAGRAGEAAAQLVDSVYVRMRVFKALLLQ